MNNLKSLVMKNVVGRLCFLLAFTLGTSVFANAETDNNFMLKNLERERAALIDVLTDQNISFVERQLKANALLQRLATVERMALNTTDTNNSQLAKQVFSQYDLSFLLHASAEQQQTLIEHWLNQLALSTNDIEQGWAGER